MDSLEEALRREQENAAISARQKGHRPSHRRPRMMLLLSHYRAIAETQRQKANAAEGMAWVSQTFITNEYQPSYRNFTDLRRITIKDLLVETVHSDSYLVLRCVSPVVCEQQ
jgi:hypothetical protein